MVFQRLHIWQELRNIEQHEAQLYAIDPRSFKDYIVNEAQLYVIDPRSVKDYIVSTSLDTWSFAVYM